MRGDAPLAIIPDCWSSHPAPASDVTAQTGVGGRGEVCKATNRGPTLANRLARGAILVDTSFSIAQQIGAALEAARQWSPSPLSRLRRGGARPWWVNFGEGSRSQR